MNEEVLSYLKDRFEIYDTDENDILTKWDYEAINKALNYISKLQKELENSISKDKIKDKIEELKDLCLICQFRESFCKDLKERTQCVTNAIITVLENLLKENKL